MRTTIYATLRDDAGHLSITDASTIGAFWGVYEILDNQPVRYVVGFHDRDTAVEASLLLGTAIETQTVDIPAFKASIKAVPQVVIPLTDVVTDEDSTDPTPPMAA